ncbi:hypothetical protein D9M71_467200 [compost metagenome]
MGGVRKAGWREKTSVAAGLAGACGTLATGRASARPGGVTTGCGLAGSAGRGLAGSARATGLDNSSLGLLATTGVGREA